MACVTLSSGGLFVLQKAAQNQILLLKLYSNDRTPSRSDTSSLYTELTHPNYTTKLLTPTEWTYAIDGLTGNWTATYALQTWTFNSPVVVYGYTITDSVGTVLFAERFPNAPISLDGGKSVKITPVLGIQ